MESHRDRRRKGSPKAQGKAPSLWFVYICRARESVSINGAETMQHQPSSQPSRPRWADGAGS